ERELVRIPDAVAADEAVVGEDLREVEVRLRRREIRQLALVAKGHIEVEEARLERLQECTLAPLKGTVEEDARVDARDRHRAARPLEAPRILVEVVAREVVAEARCHVAEAAAQRKRNRRIEDQPLP